MTTLRQRPSRLLLGLFFIVAGIAHFMSPERYEAIMPPSLPWPAALVALSGAAEILLGALVLLPQARVPARWGLIALLLVVFPANIHMAQHAASYAPIPRWALWLRLPLQGLLVAWVWWATRPEDE